MKKLLIALILTLACPIVFAEQIDISLNATKKDPGLGERLLLLDPKQSYQFTCQLAPKQIPPAGSIILSITVCGISNIHHCGYTYWYGHHDLKQPVLDFTFVADQQLDKETTFTAILQYIPLDDNQEALARYHLPVIINLQASNQLVLSSLR